jgi:hypothetical protein
MSLKGHRSVKDPSNKEVRGTKIWNDLDIGRKSINDLNYFKTILIESDI